MKKQKQEFEVLNFSKEGTDMFMEAVKRVSRRTYISNETIFKRDDRSIEIYDTRSIFLVEAGREYAILYFRKPFLDMFKEVWNEYYRNISLEGTDDDLWAFIEPKLGKMTMGNICDQYADKLLASGEADVQE